MDSESEEIRKPARKSSAERVRKHRRRQRKLELQVAVGIAKIVTGKGAGDQRKALLAVLDVLDRQSLAEQRRLTLPFIKACMAW